VITTLSAFVVRRAREDNGELSHGVRTVDIGGQLDTIAHQDALVELDPYIVYRLGGSRRLG
jgi:hypothetical protein